MDSVSRRTGVNGESGRRCSARLNKNLVFDNAGESTPPSVQRRFSPRLHKDSPFVETGSSPNPTSVQKKSSLKQQEPSKKMEQKATHEVVSDFETPVSKVEAVTKVEVTGRKNVKDLNVERRMSPRLHGDIRSEAEKEKISGSNSCASLGIGPDVHVTSLQQVERRTSPRLNSMSNGQVESSHDTSMQRKRSPNDHSGQESEKESIFLETPMQKISGSNSNVSLGIGPDVHVISLRQVERRTSPRLNSVSNGQVESSNDTSMQRKLSPSDHSGQECEKESTFLETPMQRRVSPRLHCEQENEKKKKTVEETPIQRRVSPRLHGEQLNENENGLQETLVGGKRTLNNAHADNGLSDKRSKHEHIKDDNCKKDFECSYVNEITCGSNGESPYQLALALKLCANKAMKQDDVADAAARSDHARVKETLRIFNTYYLQFVQEEEERRKQNEIDKEKQDKDSKSKENVKRSVCRPDLKAITKMREKKEILYPNKTVGHLPGIDVGYQFYSRAEMVVIGFHSHWLNGIDYIGMSKGKGGEHRNYTLPIAVAIVLSGQYEDNMDNADDIIYTGQGGNDLLGNKLQRQDQVMVRGNLALKNSMDQSVPIRVIRGHKNTDSYSGKIYSFDGLYKVVESWADKGCRGHLVYKYRLERLAGQPKLTTDQVQFVRGRPLKVVSELPGLVCRDLSNGLEDICIPVTNIVDDPPFGPQGFTYMTSIEVAASVKLPPNATGCSCKGNCTDPDTCECAKLNGSDFPYVRRDGGRLVEAKDIVFECGPNCGCKSGCLNRISQRGIKYRLEVYRTLDKGWAVRSWDFIPSGAPVCEYIGVMRRSDELDHIAGNEFIFEIDCLHTINEIEGRERRFGNVTMSFTNALPKVDKKTLDGSPEFCIDAGSRGNVARFINHSCEPNLFVQCILSTHHDLRQARIVLIAADNIAPMQELTYDYGYALDSVIGADGKVKVLPCVCGTAECRKRLY